jgi:cellulose synthase/poly-beta-1,6-N-acetylglucosamine synthase-like glycosyltransferase
VLPDTRRLDGTSHRESERGCCTGRACVVQMAVDEVRALLQAHDLTDRLPGLIARWDSFAQGRTIDSVADLLRHAHEDALVAAGFTEHEARVFLRALRASAPVGASRPGSPELAPEPEPEPQPALLPPPGLPSSSSDEEPWSPGAEPSERHRAVHRAPFRYTPVTALTPKEFPSKYGPRLLVNAPREFSLPGDAADRGIEALIVITMYNEGVDMLDETLDGICDNIAHDCAKSRDRDAWRRWAVCIVADGRQKMSKGVAAQDFYDANTAKLALEMATPGEDVRVHLFEGTRERVSPGSGSSGGKLQSVCCCCRSRRPAWCCARDLEREVGETASVSSVPPSPADAWAAPQQRITRERVGPGSGQYRTGPTYIEHLPETPPEDDADARSAVASCMRRCSACGCCKTCDGQQHVANSVPDTGLYPPLQMIVAVKEENAGKLDSHLWFFDAFADSLKPEYCFLIDVGTKPGPRSLVKLRDTLKTDEKVAGCCGQMEIDPGKVEPFNMLHAAQKFEYQLANLMDKSLESAFGFISVLPGAFSAYRYKALRCKKNGEGDDADDDVLTTYFSSINKKLGPRSDPDSLGPLKGNMFLAEDRILVFELLSWKGKDWVMRYVSSAHAYTDPVDSLEGLLKQRRRWSNGSFFAMIFTFESLPRFWFGSGHTLPRKFLITILFGYYILMQLIGWFTLAIFYLCFKFIVEGTVHDIFGAIPSEIPHDYDSYSLLVFQCVDICVVTIIGLQVIVGLGNKPGYSDEEGAHTLALYVVAAQMLAVVTAFMFGSALFQLVTMWHFNTDGDGCYCNPVTHLIDQDNETMPFVTCEIKADIAIGDQGCLTVFEKTLAVMTVGGPFVAALLHKRFFSLLWVFPRYLLCMPVFTVMVPIYSFCNMHDISWGTKGLEAPVPLSERKVRADIAAKMHKQLSRDPATALDQLRGDAVAGSTQNEPAGGSAAQDLRQSMVKQGQDMLERRKLREQGQADQNKVKQDRAQTEDEFREFRTWVVSLWLVSNLLVIMLLSTECDEEAVFNERYGDKFSGGSYKIPGLCATTIAQSPDTPMSQVFTRGILVLAGFINAFRLVGSTYFLLVDKLERWLLRPWSCGPCCFIKRHPNRKRFIVLTVGLILLLGSVVSILVVFQEEDKAYQGADNIRWTDRLEYLVDPQKDADIFSSELSDNEQRTVIALGCLGILGALGVLAAIGARPRVLRNKGEVQSSDLSNKDYKIWAGVATGVSLLLLVWGGLLVAISGSSEVMSVAGMAMFVLGVVTACVAVSVLRRLYRTMSMRNDGDGNTGPTNQDQAEREVPLLTGNE